MQIYLIITYYTVGTIIGMGELSIKLKGCSLPSQSFWCGQGEKNQINRQGNTLICCVDHNKLWKILQKMGIPDHLTCLLRNLYAGQEATVRIGHRTDWFQIRKGVCQGCKLSPCLFNLYAEYIMWNAGLDEAQAGVKITGRTINNLRYADDTTIRTESKDKLKSLLMKVKGENEKVGLKFNIQKTKIMGSSPITSWQIDGETVTEFIFRGSKITADGGCSHEIQRHLLLGWKAVTNLDGILKSRDKGLSSQSYGFFSSHVWIWEVDYKESWAQKNCCFLNCGIGEDSWEYLGYFVLLFELWDWRRLLRVPWILCASKRSKPVHPNRNQSWIFIGKTDAEVEAPIVWLPDAKNWLTGKDPDAGKDWRQEKGTTADGTVG